LSDAVLARMFVDVVGRSPALNGLLHRHVHVLFNQVAWSSACNRAHTTEQRCARWLLMTHDRVASDRYFPTQEFLMRSWGHSTTRGDRCDGMPLPRSCGRYPPPIALADDFAAKVIGNSDGDALTVLRGREPIRIRRERARTGRIGRGRPRRGRGDQAGGRSRDGKAR
jgi:hypothetical protein